MPTIDIRAFPGDEASFLILGLDDGIFRGEVRSTGAIHGRSDRVACVPCHERDSMRSAGRLSFEHTRPRRQCNARSPRCIAASRVALGPTLVEQSRRIGRTHCTQDE